MKKGFTLMELMIVIIIVGVLATLGITQYTRAIEKARSAEAKQFIGALRSQCAAVYMENGVTTNCNGDTWTANTAPTSCTPQSYFDFTSVCSGTNCTFTGTRCTSASTGKPAGPASQWVNLSVDYSTGTDQWGFTTSYQ